ncbi:MAG: flagellar basal body-associated FliL family protein [Rickettsiaceae bacterium]|nr:flagellar basal body-associated FliL family protein [Rickettsiaceae bacterium]
MAKEQSEETKDKTEVQEVDPNNPQVAENASVKGKRFLLVAIPIVIALIAGVSYGLYILYSKPAVAPVATKEELRKGSAYYYVDVNNIIVTISSGDVGGKKNYLKISLSIQSQTAESSKEITAKLPIITDSFQTFLRELRRADLSGSAGVIMLKTQLLKRVNAIIAPQEALDILFKEIILS